MLFFYGFRIFENEIHSFFESDDTEHFLMGHNLAFEYFGGYTKEILYDNLKSVVIKRAFKQKDSEFNKKFIEFSGFYGFKAVLARPYRPQTKGKVENTVRYVKEDFFNGEELKSVKDINIKAKEWLNRVNYQIHHTTHERPKERLSRESLIPFIKAYDLSKVYYRKVFSDSHLSFKGNFYSVPPKYVGKEVVVKYHPIEQGHIIVYYRNEMIALHELEEVFKGGYYTNPSHYIELKQISMQNRNQKKPKKKRTLKEEEDFEFHQRRTSQFSSGQILELFDEIEKRDLSVYEEVIQ